MELYALYLETKDYPEDVEYFIDKELAKNRMIDLLIEKNFEYSCNIHVWSFNEVPMKHLGVIEFNILYSNEPCANNDKNKFLSRDDIKSNLIYHTF